MSRRQIMRAAVVATAVIFTVWLILRPTNKTEDSSPSRYSYADFIPHFGTSGDFVPTPKEQSRDAWVDMETELMWTKVEGGLEGYYTFSNMYLNGGALVSVVPSVEALEEFPKAKHVLSGSDGKGGRPPPGDELWSQIVGEELALSELGKQVIRLPGITYLFNDQPAGYMSFFEHFAPELFIPATRSVASALVNSGLATDGTLPTRIIFPRCGAKPSWRDDNGMNRWLLSTMLPATIIEDATQWNDRAAGNFAYVFDHIVIVDRGAAHSAGRDTLRWGKMNANAVSLQAPKTFFDPFRKGMMDAVQGTLPHVGRHALPVVVLIERESEPRIEDSAHKAIVQKLRGLTGRAEIHITRIKGMTPDEKVSLLLRTDILVGLNGDDLLHMMWMKNGGTVIEIFEEDGFTRDMGLVASLLDLHHVAVRNNRVLWKEEWKDHPLGQRGAQKDGLVDVEADVVVEAVVDALDILSGKQVLGFEG